MGNANPKPRGRRPKPTQGRNEIRSDALYPISTLLRKLGISRNTLTSLRKQGLKVHFLGRRCGLVDGAELITFLRNQWKTGAEAADEANSPSSVDPRQQLNRPDDGEIPA
jgi:hypothetical protein